MKQILSISFVLLSVISLAQTSSTTLVKPPITPEVFGTFPFVTGASISDDGKYVTYTINNPAANTSKIIKQSLLTGEQMDPDPVTTQTTPATYKSESGLKIDIREKDKVKPFEGVDVWSYTDDRLQSEQLKQSAGSIVTVFYPPTKNTTVIEGPDEKMIAHNEFYGIVSSSKGAESEWNWSKAFDSKQFLVSFRDGSRKLINKAYLQNLNNFYWFSPAGKYVIYYDARAKNYFSYEIETGTKRNITASIKTTWTTYVKRDVPMASLMPIYSGQAGWLKDDQAVLLYDQNDIYQVDPSGKKLPVCITRGLGRKNNIEFRLAIESNQVFNGDEEIILSAFDRVNKNDGFYRVQLGNPKEPELLTSQPYVFKGTWEDDNFTPVAPVKAKNAEVYLVRRMSTDESPNYFWTTDFKTFNRITDVHPEKEYNWMTSELIKYKLPDGSTSQGILYKPQNFDPSKKYPVIFNYYENSSEGLHDFLSPDFGHADLEIPYYVSNGYLIFKPDMHYAVGHPGQSVVTIIVSAANYLKKFPYVDAKNMGLQGHSRGGWETNYIVTHTNIFAAAMSSAGMSDYISLYNGTRSLSNGISRQTAFEYSYQRIGATLWERPDLFIENSPIFKADKVTTPLLMMANKADDDVPYEQGVEMFTALRRLGKRAWMLQYDGQRHLVFSNAAEDRCIRMKQFFDHYLKDSACPRWMLYGVPASEKGNPDALKLVYEKDKNGKWLTPKEGGLLTEEERKKVEGLKHRKPVTVTIE